jgi:hypothetical protein
MTKKIMLETVFPNANTNNGVTFTEEHIDQDYKDGWRYIVWVGGNDDYYKNYKDAKRDYDEWEDKGYDEIYLEEIKPYGENITLEKKEMEIS